MWRIYAAIAVFWLAISPPFFTDGACTAEFDAAHAALLRQQAQLSRPSAALAYFRGNDVPVAEITPERCREAKPRFMAQCGLGTVVYARVPVKHPICRFYRDEDIKVQLEYDERGRLTRLAADMAPFKSLPIPGTGIVIHWGR